MFIPTIKLKCDFLANGVYDVEIFKDGVNADLNGNDYKTEQIKVKSGEEIFVNLAPGGGWSARFIPAKE